MQLITETEPTSVITKETLSRAMDTLRRYQAGKANLDRRIVENEQWWKLRHWELMQEQGTTPLKTRSAWLVNVLLSRHADAMDAYPEPCCLPREASDQDTARALSAILPVVLEQNDFEKVWSDAWWKKMKAGAGIYGVFWDSKKQGGLGDVTVTAIDPLSLFWEPGITDLQHSRNLFYVQLRDRDALEAEHPHLAGKLEGKSFTAARYLYDDTVDTGDKVPVIDWYYHKEDRGIRTLQLVKFTGDQVLYATEDDPELARRGLYDHGKYPFVADPLFPEEGTPLGFGYVDLCKDAQRQIDLMNNAIVANCIAAATPRFLVRGDGGVNEEEYADLTRTFVHVQGSVEDAAIKQVAVSPLSGSYLSILDAKINELKETSGNRDVMNGGTTSGVTAASAIAAMQEQSGKLSRDQITGSYRCFRQVVYLIIELLRQFYDLPRQFRITGPNGAEFVSFDNRGLLPAPQLLGARLPVFDVQVTAQKQSAYSKLSYNEMALQFFRLGLFNPALADQALLCLDMMDFQGKDALIQRLRDNGALYQAAVRPQGGEETLPRADRLGSPVREESARMTRAREAAREAPLPRE